jgi:outer membrane protein TolC
MRASPGNGQARLALRTAALAAFCAAASFAAPMRLADAVRLSLDHDPQIASARSTADFLHGVLLQSRGDFDASLSIEASLDYSRSEITPTTREAEESTRETFRLLTETFSSIADDLERQLEESDGRAFADCGDAEIFVDGVAVCSSDQDRSRAAAFDELLALLGVSTDVGDLFDDIGDDLDEQARDITRQTIDSFRATAAGTQESLDNLGEVPDLEAATTLSLDVGYSKTFRQGLVFQPSLVLEGVEDNYVGKPKSTTFGGKGLPNTYAAEVRLSFSLPLSRGHGRRAVTAGERAAELEARAGDADLRQRISERVLAAVEAFWNVLAADHRLRWIEASAGAQEQLHEISAALVGANLIPRADLARADAELSVALASVTGARRQLAAARLALARTIGLDVEGLADAPQPGDAFPPEPAAFGSDWAEPLLIAAVVRRHDLQAERLRREAARILREKAENSLRPQVDLDFTVGYLGLEERASVGKGFFGSLYKDVPGASAVLGLTVEWPVRNRVAVGQLQQAAATQGLRGIAARELERTIRAQVAQTSGRLERAASEVARRREAVEQSLVSHEATVEAFRAGEGTLFTTLRTEQALTVARLARVAAQQTYALLLARLHHQTGDLVSFDGGEPRVAIDAVARLPAGD